MRWIPKAFYRLYNPNAKRDSNGKVIDDIKRRLETRRTRKRIESGTVTLGQVDYTLGGRKYRIGARGNVDFEGGKK